MKENKKQCMQSMKYMQKVTEESQAKSTLILHALEMHEKERNYKMRDANEIGDSKLKKDLLKVEQRFATTNEYDNYDTYYYYQCVCVEAL